MKLNSIKENLRGKFNEFVGSIDDVHVRNLVRNNSFITGGAIASMLQGENVNDYDIYFRDKDTALAVAKYYVKKFQEGNKRQLPIQVKAEDDRIRIIVKSAGIAAPEATERPYQYFETVADEGEAGRYISEIMDNPGEIEDKYEEVQEAAQNTNEGDYYRPLFLTTNAISLSHRVQLIIRFFGEPDEVHENYDYIHCTNYWTSKDGKLHLREAALQALLTRELFYVGSKYPICSLFRLRKFIRRGWTINAGQILKIAMQVSELDLTDIKVLEDQLTGVDCAYFMEVMQKLKDKDPEKVNRAYLIEIMDRMFGGDLPDGDHE